MPGDEQDVHGQEWPVMISSIPDKTAAPFIGASVVLGEEEATVEFVDNAANACGKQVLKV